MSNLSERYATILNLSAELGFKPTKVAGEFSTGGRQALGSCGAMGLTYTNDRVLVHEFTHVLQYHGMCLGTDFGDGEWAINDLPRLVELDYRTLQGWVKDVLPALSSIYRPHELEMELPALFAEAYYESDDFLDGLIRLAEWVVDNR